MTITVKRDLSVYKEPVKDKWGIDMLGISRHLKPIRIAIILTCFTCAQLASAQAIKGPDQITPTTSMAPWGGFVITQIADGKSADIGPFNGFATNAKTGTMNFDLDKSYDITGFKLWNDVNVMAEGVKSFQLVFHKGDGSGQTSAVLPALAGVKDAQTYTFPKVSDVNSVDMVVLSSQPKPPAFAERIEIREIEFIGAPHTAAVAQSGINALIHKGLENPIALVLIFGGLVLGLGILLRARRRRAQQNSKPTPSQKSSERLAFGAGNGDVPDAGNSAPNGPNPPFSAPAGLPKINHPEKSGVVFEDSPMVATLVPGAGAATSAGLPKGLHNLSGVFANLKRAYRATGRIGFAQDGIPKGDETCLGTGFLIGKNRVVTNHHVYAMNPEYFENGTGVGIEFIAERDNAASEFVPFTDEEPIVIAGFDIVVFRLARSVPMREYVLVNATDLSKVKNREIAAIGYPAPYDPTPEFLAQIEEDPILAVKRVSIGHIFKHSTVADPPYLADVPVMSYIRADETMPALCHNASTAEGNSGSPIIDVKTGALLGIHFAGDPAFAWEEAANFAMMVAELARNLEEE